VGGDASELAVRVEDGCQLGSTARSLACWPGGAQPPPSAEMLAAVASSPYRLDSTMPGSFLNNHPTTTTLFPPTPAVTRCFDPLLASSKRPAPCLMLLRLRLCIPARRQDGASPVTDGFPRRLPCCRQRDDYGPYLGGGSFSKGAGPK